MKNVLVKLKCLNCLEKKKQETHCDEIGHENLNLNTEGVRKERLKKLFVKNMYFYKMNVTNSK